MNQKLEITLEITTNGHLFRATIPLGSSYDDAIDALQQFKDQMTTMKENAAAQTEALKAEAAKPAESPAAPEATWTE